MPDGTALPFNATSVVLPAYDEAGNLAPMVTAILGPVDSLDGTGELDWRISRSTAAA